MDTNQIYELVNSVTAQAFGNADLAATDATGLVSLGNTILSSDTNTESFVNTLVQRIGRTIYHYRAYRNKLRGIILESDMEWGAVLQKIDVELPEAVVDPTFELVDGESVDPWIIAKPKVKQKLFVGRNPFMFHVTISRRSLKEAFLSESAMGAFISVIFGKVRNMIEASYENLARTGLCAAIAETTGGKNRINLRTQYNTETGQSITGQAAYHDKDFLAWAVGRINLYSDYLTDMSSLYNDGSIETFTPKEDQRLTVLAQFQRSLETVTQYQAFHDGYVKLSGYDIVNFWQAAKNPDRINTKKLSDGSNFSQQNIVAVIHDRDAVGVYQQEEEVLTTPVNARGRYYNTYYHIMKNMFFDGSENIIVFTLN